MMLGAIYSKSCTLRLLGWPTLLAGLLACFLFMRPAPCWAATSSPAQGQSITLIALLQEQEQALNAALNSLEQAQTALEQSDEALTQSQDELTAANAELMQARQELAEQQQEIERLNKLLAMQQKELSGASTSIRNANAMLQTAKAEMLAADKAHQKAEKRLKVKCTLWQIIAAVCAGVAIGG